MLSFLAIRDFAIIDRLKVELEDGFVVVTGETGAGKSILVNALHLILGGRAHEDMIRTDADSAEVEGVFELDTASPAYESLAGLGLADGTALAVRRVISRTGRNRVFINDRAVSLATLAGLTRGLCDISGQHEHVGLTDEDSHRGILDDFGGLGSLRAEVAGAVSTLRSAERELSDLLARERQRAEREDYLRFALERIEAVDPRPGEDEELERERMRLGNAERLVEGMRGAVALLYEQDGSAVELIGRAVKQVAGLARFDPDLRLPADQLEGCLRAIEDLARELASAASGLHSDPDRLEQVEQRLQALRGLMRSHGPTLKAVLDKRDELAREIESLGRIESRKAELQGERHGACKHAMALAGKLSDERRRVAVRLAERLCHELASLAMPGARFEVEVRPGAEGDLDEGGIDRVRFLFSANPGEEVRPLVKVASGGELSRVLLALKTVLAEVDRVLVYVFDEVDSGVGGAEAEVIGDKLSSLAAGHQVICITHLPQIAAHATGHFSVRKRQRGGRSVSQIARLDTPGERVEEVARMVGGLEVTDKARSHARDLLDRARQSRGNG